MSDAHVDAFNLPSWGSEKRSQSAAYSPVTPDDHNKSAAYWDSKESAFRQRALQLIKERDNYIPPKERDRER